jgi:Flp pilus assembly protein TadG
MTSKRISVKSSRRSARNRQGAYTVEFALCCGLFFMIMMAGIEFTRFMYAKHSVDQAAYEAARLGIVPGATPSQVTAVANRILGATGIRNSTVTVSPSTFNGSTSTVTVSIRCPYADNSWMGPVFLVNTNLQSDITLDHENKAFLVNTRDPNMGDNDNEPVDQ